MRADDERSARVASGIKAEKPQPKRGISPFRRGEGWAFPPVPSPRYGNPDQTFALYTCHRASGPVAVDDDLPKSAWQQAPRSARFVDLVTGEPGFFDPRVACRWDDEALYVGFWIEEPQVWARPPPLLAGPKISHRIAEM